MLKREIPNEDEAHYGVSITVDKKYVLLQLGKGMDQVRVRLDAYDVEDLINRLTDKGKLLSHSIKDIRED